MEEQTLNRFRLEEWKAKRHIANYRELAGLVGVSPNTVSGWRQGQKLTTVHRNALCHVLGCEWKDLADTDPKALAPSKQPKQMRMQMAA